MDTLSLGVNTLIGHIYPRHSTELDRPVSALGWEGGGRAPMSGQRAICELHILLWMVKGYMKSIEPN